jgi:hypothetical protein
MADQVTVKPTTESNPTSATGQQTQNVSVSRSQLIILCALGLGGSFFLPWIHFFGGQVSGFDLQKLGQWHRVVWLIPLFSVITVIAVLTKQSQRTAAQLAGALPFCVGAYWLAKLGGDLFQILTFGAYLSLIFGAALIILPRTMK